MSNIDANCRSPYTDDDDLIVEVPVRFALEVSPSITADPGEQCMLSVSVWQPAIDDYISKEWSLEQIVLQSLDKPEKHRLPQLETLRNLMTDILYKERIRLRDERLGCNQ